MKFLPLAVFFMTACLPAAAQPTDNVGIGTNTPASTLTVRGQAGQPGILGVNTNAGLNLLSIGNNNRVGIGEPSPSAELHIRNGTGGTLLMLQQRNALLPATMSMSNIDGLAWQIRCYVPPGGMFPDGRWQIDNFTYGNILTLRGNATAGINNPNPVSTLDVNGNLAVTGQLKPNGNSGNSGDLLYSEGPGKAPVWKNPVASEYNNYLYNPISNSGFVGPGGSGNPPAATVATVPFSVTDTVQAETLFGLRVQASGGTTAYGYVDLELWRQSPSSMVERQRVFFKLFSQDISWNSTINTSKIFNVYPPFSGTTLYEIRALIYWNDGSSIRYGNGILPGGANDSFCHLHLVKQ